MMKKKKEGTKDKKKKEEKWKKGDFFGNLAKNGPMKRKKITHLNVWFGLC